MCNNAKNTLKLEASLILSNMNIFITQECNKREFICDYIYMCIVSINAIKSNKLTIVAMMLIYL